jgi:hypothetical protein
MLGSLVIVLSVGALPQVHAPVPPPECELDVLAPEALESRALTEFNDAVERYVLLHRRLERYLPPEQMFDDPEDMMEAREALADAIRDALPNARPGTIFTAGPAQLFRDIIWTTLVEHEYEPGEVIEWLNEEPLPGARRPVVHGSYDWGLGAWMWPALLRALPALPPELEYRIVGADLILIDLHANLVVDILENAMPSDEE